MRPVDRFAFGVLVPVWALALLLSLASIDRDIVESPLRVHGAASEDAYPTVSSLQPWAVTGDDPAAQVKPGDRLLEIAGVDARGASGPRAISLVWDGMAGTSALPLVVERDGRRLEVEGRIPRPIAKWPPLVLSLVFGALAVFGLWRFPELRVSRIAFPTLMASAVYFGARFGTTPTELLAAFWLQAGALVFLQPLTVRLVRHFPDGREGARWARGWPWLLGLNGPILVDAMLFDAGPPGLVDYGNKLITIAAPIVTLAVGIDRYRASNRTNRRRFKWLLLGMMIASTPAPLVGMLSAIRPELGAWFLPGQLAQLAVPICLWIAIARHGLFDIDRVLNVAAVVFGALLLLGGVTVTAGPAAHEALVSSGGVSEATASLLLVFAAIGVVGPAAFLARAALDRWTFAQRRARAAAVERLLASLDRADKLREIGARLTRDACDLWNARGAALFVRMEDGLQPVSREGELPEDLDLASGAPFGAMPPGAIREEGGILLDVQWPLAVRLPGGAVEGAIVVAPNRSGDPYDERDRALLAVVAERVAARLAALEHRDLLDHARALNQELSEGKRRAEEESAEKTALLASASHDLRQPVQALRLFLATLGERVEADEDRGLVEKAQLSAIAMQQQFEALLDDSRLDAGTVQAQLQPVPLDELFTEVRLFLEPLAQEKGLELRATGNGLAVRSDPSMLRSVVQNLVGNAIRYTERGRVRIDAVEGDDGVEIEVSDTGRGMDEAELQGLFEAGRRGRSAAGETQGAGLGLSIVSRLCDLLGHVIRVRSTPGEGSTISVRAERAERRVERAAASSGAGDRLAGARVVVIDDDDETREAVARLVQGWGAEVVSGATAKAVIESAPDFAPDAALLDYTLESATGLDALDELERAWGELAAAILTGESSADVAARVRERGLPLLRKPAAPVQIRAVLTSLVVG